MMIKVARKKAIEREKHWL